jgi:hypothetical protein
MLRIHHPRFEPVSRVAVLTPELSVRQIQRRMRSARVIAAAAPLLRSLALAIEAGRMVLPAVEAAVVAFTGASHGQLTEMERDLFWRVFQVPVFEQLLAPDGHVIAMECDAHDGLHVVDPASLAGVSDNLDRNSCGCGNVQPRLKRLDTQLKDVSAPPPVICSAA